MAMFNHSLFLNPNVHSLFQINKLPGDQSLFFSSFTTMGPAETHIKESTQLPGTSLDQNPECGTKQFQIHTWGPKQIQIGPQTNPYKAGNKSRLGQSGHYKLPREAPEQGTQRTTTRQRSKFLLPRCWGGARGVVGGGARREAPRSLPSPRGGTLGVKVTRQLEEKLSQKLNKYRLKEIQLGHWGSRSRDSSRGNQARN